MLFGAGAAVYWSAMPFRNGLPQQQIPGTPGIGAAFLPSTGSDERLTIDEVVRRDAGFVPMPPPEEAEVLNLKMGGQRWYRLDFHSSEPHETRKVLDLIWRIYDFAALYEQRPDGTWREEVTGQNVPPTHPRFSPRWRAFGLTLPPGETVRVYLYVKDLYRLPTQFQLWSDPDAFIRWEEALYMRLAGYYSIWFAALAYGIFLYAVLREKSQEYYLQYMGGLGLLGLTANGILSAWMPVDLPAVEALAVVCGTVVVVSLSGFARHYLETKGSHPLLDRRLHRLEKLVWWSLLLSPFAFWPPAGFYYLQGFILMTALVVASLLGAAVIRWRAGFSQAPLFVLAFSPYLIVLIYWLVYARDDLIRDDEQRVCLMIANALTFLFLSFASAYRHRMTLEKHLALQNDSADELQRQVDEQTQELKTAGADLRLAIADRDRVIALIGHDLRGPAATLFSLTRILRSDAAALSGEQLKELTGEIAQSCERQLELLNNLLMWGSAKNGKWITDPQPCPAGEVVASVCELQEGVIEAKKLVLSTRVPTDLVVYADRQALETILRNLLSNAVKFTSPGGRIVLEAEALSGTKARFAVKDTGVGISPERLEQLRQGGVRSTAGTFGEQGTGIGLGLCLELARSIGGGVEVESRPGEGTCAYVTVPLIPASRRTISAAATNPKVPVTKVAAP